MEPWIEPYAYNTFGAHQDVPPGKNHPYYSVKAVNWEKAARAQHTEALRLHEALLGIRNTGCVCSDPDAGDCGSCRAWKALVPAK